MSEQSQAAKAKLELSDPGFVMTLIIAGVSDFFLLPGLLALAIPGVGPIILFFAAMGHYLASFVVAFLIFPKLKHLLPKLILGLGMFLPAPLLSFAVLLAILAQNRLIEFVLTQVVIQGIALATGGAGEALEAGALVEGAGAAVIEGAGEAVVEGVGEAVIEGAGEAVVGGVGTGAVEGIGAGAVEGVGTKVIEEAGTETTESFGKKAVRKAGEKVSGRLERDLREDENEDEEDLDNVVPYDRFKAKQEERNAQELEEKLGGGQLGGVKHTMENASGESEAGEKIDLRPTGTG